MTEGQSWTLIARVSNKGEKHWTWLFGWWNKHDMTDAKGKTTNPLDGEDMISPAFWLVGGKEFMITRSDDPHTAPLLQTTDDCLDEQTFRDKIQTSKGRLIHNQCRSSCNVRYGGQYETTEGFEQASENGCSPANLQTDNKIGFWCSRYTADYKHNWAVMMIGARGDGCSEADHGIGISREASVIGYRREDFGNKADKPPTKDYSLNLWVR